MKKIIFLDRDGTLIEEPKEDFQVDSLQKFRFKPSVICALKTIVSRTNYVLVMVSNQDGLGTSAFSYDKFEPLQQLLINTLADEGVVLDKILIDKSLPEQNSPNRKPNTGLLTSYMNGEYNLKESIVIGDRLSDVELAVNLNAKAIYFSESTIDNKKVVLTTTDWNTIAKYLTTPFRVVSKTRRTNETSITVNLNPDNYKVPEVKTGIGFFNHMLEQFAHNAQMKLELLAVGDLYVDEHHTIEDIGITLGEAIREVVSKTKSIGRYGFYIPMDEALAEVFIDISNRPFLKWDVELTDTKVGNVDSTLFKHFFYSFCYSAGITMHVKSQGENNHHIIEAIFKAFGRALKLALQYDESNIKPSTK